MTITPGENVGPYRVIEQLGSGGMATVFKSYHASLDRYVAIKVLHPAFKADPQFFERFKREARIVAKLEHPNIIPVYDFNEHQGEPYLVMRFVEGDTLKPKMKGQPMPPTEVMRLIRPVCEALAYAHRQGVLHRDIKPSNIMVTKDESIFVTDFGLARMVEAGESTLSQDMMVGTPQYISPEQAQGIKDLDGRTDIYSLGVVLYEMLTGRVPFSADTPFATVHDHIYTPLPPPSSINPEIDPAIERMLLKALAKDPEDRYATANDLLEALETTLGAQIARAPTVAKTTPAVSPAGQDKKKRMPWWVWAGGVMLILFICLVAALLFGRIRRNRMQNLPPVDGRPAPTQVSDSNQPAPPPNDEPGQSDQPPPPPADEPGEPAPPPPADEPGEPPPGPPSGDGPGQPGEPPPLPPGVDPDSPEYQQAVESFQQAREAIERGQPEEAIELFEQAIEAEPAYLPAYFGLSDVLKRMGNRAESLEVLEEALANNPEDPMAFSRLGEEYLLDDNPEAALEVYEQASERMPNEAMPYAGQALALLMMDQNDEAKEPLDQAQALDPFSPEARLANAVYLFKQGERQEAVQELRQLTRDQRVPVFVRERAKQMLERLQK
jgi:serine/threonine-protein kinase